MDSVQKCIDLISAQISRRKRTQDKTVKFIDLFAGLGGIRLGFENAFREKGFNPVCVFSSEIKDYAIKAYKNYFNDEEVAGDITQISATDIEDFDFLLGGFPCQPFSAAGLGLGFEDTRGTLFFEIERILKEKQPYGFLLENVEGLINHDDKEIQKIRLFCCCVTLQPNFPAVDVIGAASFIFDCLADNLFWGEMSK